jgi:hypothetical protein
MNFVRGTYAPGPGRCAPGAVLLNSGEVLVFGGSPSGGPGSHSELYDPVGNSFPAGSVAAIAPGGPLSDSPGILIPGGDVISFSDGGRGGSYGQTVRYSAVANTWSVKAPMLTPRFGNDMRIALLPSGKIITVGGAVSPIPPRTPQTTVDIYDPVADTWVAANPIADAVVGCQLSMLSTGDIRRSGGHAGTWAAGADASYLTLTFTTEQFNEGTGLWTALDSRQLGNYAAYYPDSNTKGGIWDRLVTIITGTDVIFVITGNENGSSPNGEIEQYRP